MTLKFLLNLNIKKRGIIACTRVDEQRKLNKKKIKYSTFKYSNTDDISTHDYIRETSQTNFEELDRDETQISRDELA